MVSLKSILSIFLISGAIAFPAPPAPGCGQVNVFFTGLPPYHPLVIAQGFNPAAVAAALQADRANVLAAGYNIRGPEIPSTQLAQKMEGIPWWITGVGYGVRGSSIPNVTVEFTNDIDVYRQQAPLAPIVFNYSPNTTLWAVQRKIPLSSNCTGSPGRDLGYYEICDPSYCVKPSS